MLTRLMMLLMMLMFLTDPRRKYHVKLLAFSAHGDGYQAHQIVSTTGCPCESTWNHLKCTMRQEPVQGLLEILSF